MIIEGVEPNSNEWLQMRQGIVTASRLNDVLAVLKRGDGEAAKRRDYKWEIVCERLTGRSTDHYVTPAMEWGADYEPAARAAYIQAFGVRIEPIGFAIHDDIKWFGASPDGGAVESDGLVEFKCPTTQTHLEWVSNQVVPSEHMNQMYGQMACTGRQWCDFVSFDPRLPKGLRFFVQRLRRDEERIAQIEQAVTTFLGEVDALLEQLQESVQIVREK